jgi:hypothetical protein
MATMVFFSMLGPEMLSNAAAGTGGLVELGWLAGGISGNSAP